MAYTPKEYINTGQDPLDVFTTDANKDLYTSIRSQLEEHNLGELSDVVLSLVQQYGSDMKETIKAELRNTEAYKNRFAGNITLEKSGFARLSEAEYLYNEIAYGQTLTKFHAPDLATRSNFAEFIGKNISPVELADRFNLAVENVQKADPALKAELRKMYPGIEDSDLARSLLMGKEGSQFLKSRIGQAGILAEATNAGITLQNDAAFLEAQGVTRADAQKTLSSIKENTQSLATAAQTFGENTDAASIQKQLESESLLGIQSNQTKRLASQQRAQFEGTSGTVTGSLRKKPSGLI